MFDLFLSRLQSKFICVLNCDTHTPCHLAMSFAPTFGSFGDFLSIALLIKDITSALNDSRGSARKYQGLIQSLATLNQTIQAVKTIYLGPRHADALDHVSVTVLKVVEQIKQCLEQFGSGMKKYSQSLQPGGSGNVMKDAARKLQFKFEEKEVEELHLQTVRYSTTLNVLLDVTVL